MKKIDPILIYNGWNVYDNPHGFYCVNNGKTLYFNAEYKGGTYFKINSYSDGKRTYTAQRYLIKMIPTVQEMTFQLLQHGYLWDYKNNCPGLDSYKKDMQPYYQKCKEKGMDTGEFLESLFS